MQDLTERSVYREDHEQFREQARDRKSTRLNSSHLVISYAVFCLKKKKTILDLHRFLPSQITCRLLCHPYQIRHCYINSPAYFPQHYHPVEPPTLYNTSYTRSPV